MASIGITASISLHRACTNKPSSTQARPSTTHLVIPNVKLPQHPPPPPSRDDETLRFCDKRWTKGTWDLNMFVKQGRMDWDSLILAEATRRKHLEMHPEASSNDEPVEFRSSIIPWWAWILHSYLPQAELLNGRAAMVGFFMAYFVDALTGLDMVGQNGNFFCKAALFFTIVAVLLFRKKEDVHNIRKLADEATFYDKQWQASWQNHERTKD